MGLCASSSSNNNFPAPKSPGSKLPVVPGGGGKYGMNQNGNGNSKFIIDSGNFSTTKLIKRTENPAESLKLCKFNGQGDRKVCLKLYKKEVLEGNTMLLEKIVDASETSAEIENLYVIRLYHSFHSASSRIWYLGTSPFIMDLVHYINSNQKNGLESNVAKQLGAEIALGLEALHKAEQVHGELRPGNILITPTGHASISLYPVEVLCSGAADLYKLDDVRFDPPESPSGDDTMMIYTQKDDWWCYGLILYQLFHGKPLFDGDTSEAIEAQKNVRPEITINPSDKMLANGPLHELIKGLLTVDESNRASMKEVNNYYVFEESNIVDWKKTRYGETEGIKYSIDVNNILNNSPNIEKGDNIDKNWEYDVSLLDGEQNTEANEGVDAVLLGVIEDGANSGAKGNEKSEEIENNAGISEEELFDSLCNRWDQNIEVDTLNQFSLNLQATKFDKFVAYGTKVKAKSGRELDPENQKQFKLLNETVGNTSTKVVKT